MREKMTKMEEVNQIVGDVMQLAYDNGKLFARQQVLDYILHHAEEQVDISADDIAGEIEYLQRQEIKEKTNG